MSPSCPDRSGRMAARPPPAGPPTMVRVTGRRPIADAVRRHLDQDRLSLPALIVRAIRCTWVRPTPNYRAIVAGLAPA